MLGVIGACLSVPSQHVSISFLYRVCNFILTSAQTLTAFWAYLWHFRWIATLLQHNFVAINLRALYFSESTIF